jgi:hypothetical protein
VGEPAEVLGWDVLLFTGAAVAGELADSELGTLLGCWLVETVQLLRNKTKINRDVCKILFCIRSPIFDASVRAKYVYSPTLARSVFPQP